MKCDVIVRLIPDEHDEEVILRNANSDYEIRCPECRTLTTSSLVDIIINSQFYVDGSHKRGYILSSPSSAFAFIDDLARHMPIVRCAADKIKPTHVLQGTYICEVEYRFKDLLFSVKYFSDN
jgi:hypothetical protein